MFRDLTITLLSRVSTILALLFCTPFFYRVLGADGYALVAISLIAHSLSGLVDAGLSPLAAAALARNADGAEKQASTLAEIYGRSLRRILPLLIAAITIMSAYGVVGGDYSRTRVIGVVALNAAMFADVFLLVLFRIQYACIQGIGRHVAANLLYAATIGLRALLGVGAVLLFREAQWIFVAQALSSLVGIGCAARILEYSPTNMIRSFWRSTYRFRDNYENYISTSALQNLWIISFFASATSIAPQLAIKLLGNPADLSRFSLASSLANSLLALQMAYQSVLLPRFARDAQQGEDRLMADAAIEAMTGTFIITLICGGVFNSAENLIALWLGDFNAAHLSAVSELMRLQLISVALLSATAVPYVLCIVKGRTRPQLVAGAIYFGSTIASTPLAYKLGGAVAVAVASTLATAIFLIFYIFAADIVSARERLRRVVRWVFLPLAMGAMPALLGAALERGSPTSYLEALLNLVVQGGSYMVFALAIALPAYRLRQRASEVGEDDPSTI